MHERLVFLHVGCLFLQAASRTDDIRPRDADSTFLCVCRRRERKKGRHRFFCCFSFHLSAVLLGSCGTRWALFLTHSVCHFLLRAAKKNPTYAQLRLVSPPRQINGVSASVRKVISGG